MIYYVFYISMFFTIEIYGSVSLEVTFLYAHSHQSFIKQRSHCAENVLNRSTKLFETEPESDIVIFTKRIDVGSLLCRKKPI